jgi:hypothetical protein
MKRNQDIEHFQMWLFLFFPQVMKNKKKLEKMNNRHDVSVTLTLKIGKYMVS